MKATLTRPERGLGTPEIELASRRRRGPTSNPGIEPRDARIVIADVNSLCHGSPGHDRRFLEPPRLAGLRQPSLPSSARMEAYAVYDDAKATSDKWMSAFDGRWHLIDARKMETDGSIRPAEFWISAFLWVEYIFCRRRVDLILLSHSEALIPDLEGILRLGVRASIVGRLPALPNEAWEIESEYRGRFQILDLSKGDA